MGFQTVIVFHSACGREPPRILSALSRELGLTVSDLPRESDVLALVNRTLPRAVIMDGEAADSVLKLCRALKSDAFSAIVPVVVMAPGDRNELVELALEAGADEVLTETMPEREQVLRIRMTLNRADRDVSVHPTTRLAGTPQIERNITERIHANELFAVCYADLDHFKEFNDRYGYNEGDRVIRLLSRILRDIVKGHSNEGFIGHIGGDDFIFTVSLEKMRVCCEEIIEVFDELIPFQYTEEDRRAGYFLGRDRRGNILWVPMMTLSIGVVTNQHRKFTHTARVSELATEMKSFAKKLPGSVYAVDRRSDARGTFFGRSIVTADELETRAES
jgi:GGDEF domain-containing protein